MSQNKNKSVYKYIHCDVYKRGISIVIGDCEALKKYVNKTYNLEKEKDLREAVNRSCTETRYSDTNVSASFYFSDSGQFVVHLPKFSFSYNPTEIANMSHELLHATHGILDFVGVEYRYSGANEPYTYLHEYLLTEALDKKGYKVI